MITQTASTLQGVSVMRSHTKTRLHVEALEDRCLLSFNPALLGPVGLVAESAAVSDCDNGSNHDLASASSVSPAAQSTQDCRLVGSWTTAASMAEPRAFYSATLLDDGRVLGAWTRVADMSTPRSDHIQELLDDGRVLVAGGFSGTVRAPIAYFASAEIYDPVSNTWTPTGSMTMPRADAEGVRLENGQVMATGGNTAISVPATRTNTAEIYDRSEERRVGKECRLRWSPCNHK